MGTSEENHGVDHRYVDDQSITGDSQAKDEEAEEAVDQSVYCLQTGWRVNRQRDDNNQDDEDQRKPAQPTEIGMRITQSAFPNASARAAGQWSQLWHGFEA